MKSLDLSILIYLLVQTFHSLVPLCGGYIVHNITLDGPITPLVFSSLPFLIHTTSITPVTKAPAVSKTSTSLTVKNKVFNVLKSLSKGLLRKDPQDIPSSTQHTHLPPLLNDTFQDLHTISATIPHKSHILPPHTSNKSPELKRRANFSQYSWQPSRGFTNGKRLNADEGYTRNTHQYESFLGGEGHLNSGYNTQRHGVYMDKEGHFNANVGHLKRLSPTEPVPESMLITLGTVEAKRSSMGGNQPTGDFSNDEDLEFDLAELDTLLGSGLSNMTKPLIYFRQSNDSGKNGTRGLNRTAMGKPKVVGPQDTHVCISKCPRTLVSIVINIEKEKKLCTGILLVENYVLTSGTCIPADWRPWFVTHPDLVQVTPLDDTFQIETVKVRYYSDQQLPWPERADIIVLKVETSSGDQADIKRSTFDPSRMYVQQSECFLYVFKHKNDTSGMSIGPRKLFQPEYDSYYYEADYVQARKRTHDLVKLRLTNIMVKPNRTVLGMNSSQLLFSEYKKPFNYTTGVVFCDDSFDSLLYTSLNIDSSEPRPFSPQPISMLVFLNLDVMFNCLNRFVFEFRNSMMQINTRGDYFNVDEIALGGAARMGGHCLRRIGNVALCLCYILAVRWLFYVK